MVAAARAAATRQAVIDDPFAEPLVRAVGVDFFTRLAAGETDFADLGGDAGLGRMTDNFAARTTFFDNFFTGAAAADIRQIVIVASGLDSRAYRLPWPAGTTVYEIDQPEVIEFKTTTLNRLGAAPTADRRTVAVDLRQDWPAALRRAGFDPTQPTAWNAEGLLIGFLPPHAEQRLLDHITALSAAGSRFAADYGSLAQQSEQTPGRMATLADRWRDHGVDIDVANLTYAGDHTDVAAYLQAHGWDTAGASLADLFATAGLSPLQGEDLEPGPASIVYVTGTRR
jgi:methyltransferase (TIGR00027 family)